MLATGEREGRNVFRAVVNTVDSFVCDGLLIVLLVNTKICFAVHAEFPRMELFGGTYKSIVRGPRSGKTVSSFRTLVISATSHIKAKGVIKISSTVYVNKFNSMF